MRRDGPTTTIRNTTPGGSTPSHSWTCASNKVFYFRRCMLGLYIDLQNVAGGRLRQPDVLMSTGEIENPSAPASERRYRMKYLEQVSGTLLPTLGLTVEF